MNDAKVIGGINRQLDILAVNLKTGDQFHIESSVTHRLGWAPKPADLKAIFEKKFLGLPEKREGKKTDHALGKQYQQNILDTYAGYGLDPKRIQRVFVCWVLHSKSTADELLQAFEDKHKMPISILSFRDTILPELREEVGTANYDDEILRTIGFLKERDLQTQREKRTSRTSVG
ncbi:MAG: hypothetical protein K1X78_16245 [Verrucomicrobiaceae bacterium]|nr:hypothetical protein [Verrucomicrobiaceae bacterium]HNJ06109.1 hypothetical protein [Leptospiraceae bacterium]